MNRRRLSTAVWTAILSTALSLTACSGSESTTSAGTDSDSDASTSEGESSTTVGPGTSGSNASSSSTSTGSDPATSDDSANFLTDPNPTSGPTGPLPNGSMCTSDSDCESMNCYVIEVIGTGFCSECNEDSDCPEDAPSCPIDIQSMQAMCTPAGLGVQCSNDAVCQSAGLWCQSVLPGIELFIPQIQTCGECKNDSHCENGQLCNPYLDVMGFSGYTQCIDPGTAANDALCSADEACVSGFCNATEIMGLPIPLTFDVCGECADDGDCMGNQTCQPGSIDMMGGLSGTKCV